VRSSIRFLRRGRVVELTHVPPMQTVLDYLRLDEKSMGTKEGCNEGDCGACTVAVGEMRHGRVTYSPINACICLVGQLDGKELVTVDDLAAGGELHPVQEAMVENHASQCGFCTPGFVMSLFTLYHEGRKASRAAVVDHIAGNLCRCTGYKPIVDAGLAACRGKASDQFGDGAALAELRDDEDVFCGDEASFFAAPASQQSLCALAVLHPDATIVAGATDVGLWITKQLRELPKIIHIGRCAGLNDIVDNGTSLTIGAGVTYERAMAQLTALSPDMGETLRRLGAKQVRASGTIGGNIANGSPIGDMPPMLIALGAKLTLRHGDVERHLALEDFFVDYGVQDRQPGELVWCVDVPKLRDDEVFRCYKISKRFDQDISAVMAAFKFVVTRRVIETARIAFGGMAATPKRAQHAEAALEGAHLDKPETWQAALDALAEDYRPITDMRASSGYRRDVAAALLGKALMESAGADPRGLRFGFQAA
jgi:xanthine dehydrogenase small subunit